MGDKGLVQRTFTLFSSVFEEIICSLIRFHYEISPLELDTSLRYNLFDHFFLLLRSESGVETILCELGLLFGNKIESFPRHYHLRNRCITRLLLFGREMHAWLMGFQLAMCFILFHGLVQLVDLLGKRVYVFLWHDYTSIRSIP